jgi:NAD(P)-dependent dehydrogenase (short-subunit alcohol dehydrogenase family)
MTSTTQPQELSGRRAIVTGAGRGIGRAIAHDLANAGAVVHVVSQSQNATLVADEIRTAGGDAIAHVGSVADEAFCSAVMAAAENAGGADILVNAAAVLGPDGKFSTLSMSAFAEAIAVNLMGTCNFMRAALPGMETRGFGRIVNFAGGGAAYSYPGFSAYAASKVAVVRLTETVADEIKTENVTVNVIAPGAVSTDTLAEVRRRGGEVRTVVAMEEPVRLVHFLCTEGARDITGRFIHARDDYRNLDLFKSKDMLKLRRTEIR